MTGMVFGTYRVGERVAKHALVGRLDQNGTAWRCECMNCGEHRIIMGKQLVRRMPVCPFCAPTRNKGRGSALAMRAERELATLIGRATLDPQTEGARTPLVSEARMVYALTLREWMSVRSLAGVLGMQTASCARMIAGRTRREAIDVLAGLTGLSVARIDAASRGVVFKGKSSDMMAAHRPMMSHRGQWDAALSTLEKIESKLAREKYWRAACKAMFPHSWRKQAMQLPRGFEVS